MLIDTHAHIYVKEFATEYHDMLQRAYALGVERIYLPNIDLHSIPEIQAIQKLSDKVYPMMGLHPCHVKEDYQEVLNNIYHELKAGNYHGIGETGIDLYWDPATLPLQIEAFKIQCKWANEFDLPIIIHSRDATTIVIELLEKMSDRPCRGVFHCFGGTVEEIDRINAMGDYYYGIGGVITFKNGGLAEKVHLISKQKLVLETDSPYLAPSPHRGKRNEPSYLPLVVKKLSECLKLSVEETENLTTENAIKLFAKN